MVSMLYLEHISFWNKHILSTQWPHVSTTLGSAIFEHYSKDKTVAVLGSGQKEKISL